MFLVVDVGNTNIVLGIYKERELLHHFRIGTNRQATVDEYGVLIYNLFQMSRIQVQDIEGVIISSVVPPLMHVLEALCEKYLRRKPLVVGPGIKTGLNLRYENPREVGADRIVNAVAAIEQYGGRSSSSTSARPRRSTASTPKAIIWAARSCRASAFRPRRCISGRPSCRASSWRSRKSDRPQHGQRDAGGNYFWLRRPSGRHRGTDRGGDGRQTEGRCDRRSGRIDRQRDALD